jgi:chromosome transmission fidelity protein 4
LTIALAFNHDQDKVNLKLFAATVEAGKLERALDLVDRFHLEKSYELAMTIADSHRKLVDLIEDAKDRKFGGPEQENDYELAESPEVTESAQGGRRISPDFGSARKGKRPFDDGTERHVRQKHVHA